MGFRYRVAIEMEYYLLPGDPISGRGALTRAGDRPVDVAGYFGVGEDIVAATRDAVMLALQSTGISVGGAHHETGPGQEEIDLNDTDALTMADQLITVRQVIRSVAQRAGLRATFMPKPMADAPGSGIHVFQGLQRVEDDGDAFTWDASDLTGEAYWFIGGQLRHAAGMSLITNPTVNSYKRLNAGHRAPRHATWARVSQASLIRVPSHLAQQAAELELRSPDALANPYLALAVALTCGLDGIRHRVDPPEPLDESFVSYDEGDLDRRGILRLPTHLGEAIAALEADDLVRATLGDYLTDQLLTVKRAEWQDYRAHVSPWELARYADA
jgi:glutamine synthetase